MVKRYIITHITFIFRIADLIFFRDAGTDKGKLVCDFQIFLRQPRTEKLEGSVNGRVYFDGTAFFKKRRMLSDT